MKNTKGFTLVELLAVIVVLAVIMLMAITFVEPLMTRSRKSVLGTEGLTLVDAAKAAYQVEQMKTGSSNVINAKSSVCFDLDWLNKKGYFEKDTTNDGYSGSVLITYNNGTYSYKFWISNGIYMYNGMSEKEYDPDNDTLVKDSDSVSNTCATDTRLVNCYGSSACAKIS